MLLHLQPFRSCQLEPVKKIQNMDLIFIKLGHGLHRIDFFKLRFNLLRSFLFRFEILVIFG